MALRTSCCMLAGRNYAIRIERCFWVPPDRHAYKNIYDWWLCYVNACDELTATRRMCDELTVWRVDWCERFIVRRIGRFADMNSWRKLAAKTDHVTTKVGQFLSTDNLGRWPIFVDHVPLALACHDQPSAAQTTPNITDLKLLLPLPFMVVFPGAPASAGSPSGSFSSTCSGTEPLWISGTRFF